MPPPKRPWFRVYVEIVWDRKIRRLSPAHRWLWVVMLALARQSPIPGFLMLSEKQSVGWDDLADAASMTAKEVEKGTDALQAIGLIDFDKALDAWSIPKWNDRQFESDETAKRTAKHRRKTVPSPKDVAPPEDRGQKQKPEAEPGSGLPGGQISPPSTNGGGGEQANQTCLSVMRELLAERDDQDQQMFAPQDLTEALSSLRRRLATGETFSTPVEWVRSRALTERAKRLAAVVKQATTDCQTCSQTGWVELEQDGSTTVQPCPDCKGLVEAGRPA